MFVSTLILFNIIVNMGLTCCVCPVSESVSSVDGSRMRRRGGGGGERRRGGPPQGQQRRGDGRRGGGSGPGGDKSQQSAGGESNYSSWSQGMTFVI